MSAFSINWPFVAFSGIDDYIVVYSAAYLSLIHRIQIISNPTRSFKIFQTCIADSKDVYVLAYTQEQFQLYSVDLNHFDPKEQ